MICVNLYDDDCSELIFDYIGQRFDDFCSAQIHDDLSCLEYTERHFSDFKDWARKRGFQVSSTFPS